MLSASSIPNGLSQTELALPASHMSHASQNYSAFFKQTRVSRLPDRTHHVSSLPRTNIYMSITSPKPQAESNSRSSVLSAGEPAPEFTLQCTPDQSVSLSEFHGRPVVLAFYPADWSPVCGDQMALYNEMLDEFQQFQAELIGISVDGVWCHAAFAKHNKLHFPLLADFEPKGAVARAYGVYDGKDGTCERALFVIAPNGTIHWSYLSPIGVNPGANGILSALENLKMKSETFAAAK
jgi:peroxiredoxin